MTKLPSEEDEVQVEEGARYAYVVPMRKIDGAWREIEVGHWAYAFPEHFYLVEPEGEVEKTQLTPASAYMERFSCDVMNSE